jgi:hypothetical protein
MNKQTKLLIGLAAIGAAAYYLWYKNKVAKNQSNTDMPPLSRDFGREANSASDCKSDETFVQVNCIMPPCPSICKKNTQSFTGGDKFFKTHSQNCSGLNCA